jgi:hypothetical protein
MHVPNILRYTITYTRDRVTNKLLDIKFISTKDLVANGFTKTSAVKDLDEFKRSKIFLWFRLGGLLIIVLVSNCTICTHHSIVPCILAPPCIYTSREAILIYNT